MCVCLCGFAARRQSILLPLTESLLSCCVVNSCFLPHVIPFLPPHAVHFPTLLLTLSFHPPAPPVLQAVRRSVQCRAVRGAEDRGFMVFGLEEHLIQGQRVTFNCGMESLFPVMQPPNSHIHMHIYTHMHTHARTHTHEHFFLLSTTPSFLTLSLLILKFTMVRKFDFLGF